MRNSFQSRGFDDGWFQVLPGLILELLGSVSWTMDRAYPLAVGATGLVVERLVGFAPLRARAGRDRPLVALAFLGRGQKFGCGRWSRCRRHGGGRCRSGRLADGLGD